MADNYLERKMEEHRSGRTGPAAHRRADTNALSADMPRRIAIIARGRRHLAALAAPLRHPRIRLAIINTITEADTDLGADHGIRYYRIDPDESIADTLRALTHTWLGIDLLILADPEAYIMARIAEWLPERIPDGHIAMPAIIVGENTLRRLAIHPAIEDGNPAGAGTDTGATPAPLPDTALCPVAAHIPYLALRTSADITAITL